MASEQLPSEQWDLVADVVVVGSGAAGLSAAIAAAEDGAEVLLLERAEVLGGTTAYSGGVAWIPNNDHMRELELPDSREQALTYLRAASQGRARPELLEAFVDRAPEAARFLEERTPLRFTAAGRGDPAGGVLPYPDYQSELPGAAANGRSLDPVPFDPSVLGEVAGHVREPMPYSVSWSGATLSLESERWEGGLALVGALLAGCLDRGVRIERGVRARALIRDGEGAVVGLEAVRGGSEGAASLRVGARRGLVLAAGGFEWNEALRREWLRGPVDVVFTPADANEGDGVLLAMEAGAGVGNLGEAWWTLALRRPDPNAPTPQHEYRFCTRERALPGSVLVNRAGRRFVNEAVNYHDIARAFHHFDPASYEYPNRPTWLVFGEWYRRRYGILGLAPDEADPDWLQPAGSLEELAAREGIDANGLAATLGRFDGHAAEAADPDFGRGDGAFERVSGDSEREGAARTLAPVGGPPYYALPVLVATLGTNSGLRADAEARVLDVWGQPIPGLYGAGNTLASPTGMAYGGAGGTIGPALTFGLIAGRNAAASAPRF